MRVFNRSGRFWSILFLILAVTGVALLDKSWHDERNKNSASLSSNETEISDYYSQKIQPIFNNRCIGCHSCFNAPCQLNLGSYEGFERGANKANVFATRLNAASPTRLYIDAQSAGDWRRYHDFFNVEENNALLTLLSLKQAEIPRHPSDGKQGIREFQNKNFCARTPAEVSEYAQKFPKMGMPLGFPKIEDESYKNILQWIQAGYNGPTEATQKELESVTAEEAAEISIWERFFNEPSKKQQLVSRYLYEHLFLGHLYFSQTTLADSKKSFFRLTRSTTPPGRPVVEIPSVRPMDDPGSPFFYRFTKVKGTIVHKTHITFALNPQILNEWKDLFLNSNWELSEDQLPKQIWDKKIAYNPFIAFENIPAVARYQFLIKNSRYIFDTFIRGTICRGESAANFIDDQFFVFFLDPSVDPLLVDPQLYKQAQTELIMPAEGDGLKTNISFHKYKKAEQNFLALRSARVQKLYPQGPKLTDLWNGDGNINPNAALTIFRHFDGASVHNGLLGANPRSVNVFDYAIFERVYYTFAAEYNVFGSIRHNLSTREYADVLRREGEDLFLSFFSPNDRMILRKNWYQGQLATADTDLRFPYHGENISSQVKFNLKTKPEEKMNEFIDQIANYLGPKITTVDPINRGSLISGVVQSISTSREINNELLKVAAHKGHWVQFLPDLSYLRVRISENEDKIFTLIHNRSHLNLAFIALDRYYNDPENDTLTILPGMYGSYPKMFFDISIQTFDTFFNQMKDLKKSENYLSWRTQFGVERTSGEFWKTYDYFNQKMREQSTIDAGILDFLRYED
jgi:hypothetical protein